MHFETSIPFGHGDVPKTLNSNTRESFDPVRKAQRLGSEATMNYRGPANGARRFSGTDRYPLHELANVYQESITPCIIDGSSGRTSDVPRSSYPICQKVETDKPFSTLYRTDVLCGSSSFKKKKHGKLAKREFRGREIEYLQSVKIKENVSLYHCKLSSHSDISYFARKVVG